jgi:hypothetical protein
LLHSEAFYNNAKEIKEMAIALPQRFIGYGAYNLCFDRHLGVKNLTPLPTDKDFFAYLQTNYPMINLVKVICFRKSTQEGLPTSRAIPLFIKFREPVDPGPPHTILVHEVNEEFLQNLLKLVNRAAATNIWVQVCIFSYQSVAQSETPEDPLPSVNPARLGTTPEERLFKFFSPDPSPCLETQKEIVRLIGNRLKGKNNVLWELVNEVRMDLSADQNKNKLGNCNLAKWLNIMAAELKSPAAYGPGALITTSTGVNLQSQEPVPNSGAKNEEIIFSPNRVNVGCGQPAQFPAFTPSFFDFHSGQWEGRRDYSSGMTAAKSRISVYNPTATLLIINDDGAPEIRTPANLKPRAISAFSKRLSYATKQSYPNGGTNPQGVAFDFNTEVLNALKAAHLANP